MKRVGLILMSALAFDLGAVVATGHASQVNHFLKADGVQDGDSYKWRLDALRTPQACMLEGGVVAKESTGNFCKIPSWKLPGGAAPSNQGQAPAGPGQQPPPGHPPFGSQ